MSRLLVLIGALALAVACASPEASRTRGGGKGADVGNHGDPVEIHGDKDPYHSTPQRGPSP